MWQQSCSGGGQICFESWFCHYGFTLLWVLVASFAKKGKEYKGKPWLPTQQPFTSSSLLTTTTTENLGFAQDSMCLIPADVSHWSKSSVLVVNDWFIGATGKHVTSFWPMRPKGKSARSLWERFFSLIRETREEKAPLPLPSLLPDLDAVAETWCLLWWQPSLEHKGKHHGHTTDGREEGPRAPRSLGTTLIYWTNLGPPVSRFLVKNQCLYGLTCCVIDFVLFAAKQTNKNLYK